MKSKKKNNWLKLKNDFFDSFALKKLRKIAGGDTYLIIYQKMMLLTINSEGHYTHQNLESTIEEELALFFNEDLDNIKMTFSFLKSSGLMQVLDNQVFFNQVPQIIGKYDDSAKRVAKYRAKQLELRDCNALQNVTVTQSNALCNDDVTKCNDHRYKSIEYRDKNKDKEIDKEKRNKKKYEVIEFNFDNFSDQEIEYTKKWLQHLKEKKKKHTTSSLDALRETLLKIKKENNLVEAIVYSLTANFSKVFPEPKNKQQFNSQPSMPWKELPRSTEEVGRVRTAKECMEEMKQKQMEGK